MTHSSAYHHLRSQTRPRISLNSKSTQKNDCGIHTAVQVRDGRTLQSDRTVASTQSDRTVASTLKKSFAHIPISYERTPIGLHTHNEGYQGLLLERPVQLAKKAKYKKSTTDYVKEAELENEDYYDDDDYDDDYDDYQPTFMEVINNWDTSANGTAYRCTAPNNQSRTVYLKWTSNGYTIGANVHYSDNGNGTWSKAPGNAYVKTFTGSSTTTPQAVVNNAPNAPPPNTFNNGW